MALPPRRPRQRRALLHAEPMLLIDDRKGQAAELHALAEQRVRADRQVDLPASERCRHLGRSALLQQLQDWQPTAAAKWAGQRQP